MAAKRGQMVNSDGMIGRLVSVCSTVGTVTDFSFDLWP